MDVKQLKYLDTLVRTRSYTKAAKELFISQPSLSIAIKNFETEVGFKLFERNIDGIVLTEQEEELHQKSKHLINGFAYVEEEIERIKHRGVENLKIGLIESFRRYSPLLVQDFIKSNPKMNITLIERNSNGVLEELLDYNIHFGITTNEVAHENIECVKLMSRTLSIVYNQEHNFNNKKNVDIKNFEGETLIQSIRGSQLYGIVNREIAKNQINLGSTINVESLETALELVRHNIGVALLPTPYVRNLNDEQILYFELDDYEYFKNDMNIIYHKNRYLPEAVLKYIREVSEDEKWFNKKTVRNN